MKFIRAVLIHMRPYLFFVSGLGGVAGMSLYEGRFETLKLISLLFCFYLGYGFGQALTDCSQLDTDKLSSPYRPLSKGDIKPKQLAVVSVLGLLIISVILIYNNSFNIITCILSVAGLSTYTFFKKNYWMGGPIWNSWIVSLLPMMGLLSSSRSIDILEYHQLTSVILFNFFAYFNFVLIGYLKDISADRQTGYKTFPVIFGWNKTTFLGDLILILAILFLTISIKNWNNIVIPAFLISIIVGIYGQLKAHLVKDKIEANAKIPIESTVRFFILGNSAIVISNKPDWLIIVLISYILFELSLYFRPEATQI